MADYSKLTKRELIMTLYARDLMLENERKHLEEYKQSLKETIDHYEKYCSEINHQNVMVYAAARNYEDKCKLLQDKLSLTEKALELMAKSVWSDGISCMKFLDTGIQVNSQVEYLEYFKTKAKEMMESEQRST